MATRKNPLRTAGTQLWIINKRTNELFEVGCLTSFGEVSNPKQLEDATCMRDLVQHQAVVGTTAGTTSIGVRFDHREAVNFELFEAYKNDDELLFAIGFPQFDSDGLQIHPDDAEVPTIDQDPDDGAIFEFGGDRVYLVFEGIFTDFPISGTASAYFDMTIPVAIQGGVDFAPDEALPNYEEP